MTRLPDIEPDKLTPEQKRISDEIASVRGGHVRGPFAIWIRIPEIADTANQFGNALRLHGKLDRRLFELIIAIVARDWSAQYEWFAHMRRGFEAGLSPDVYEAIRTRRVPKFANEDEYLVYELVNELIQTKTFCQESYDRAVGMLGLENLIEIITDVGFYTTIAMVLNAFDVPVPDSVRAGKSPL
ncbi:MAG: carboxymuconolactone decarboxylase family protein [Nitrososphaerales archaeon]